MYPRVVVIGAGWAGLSAARTYTLVNPEVDLTILDDDTSVGGVWSSSRLYPGLVADSPRGLFEYSDMSMLDEEVFASSQEKKTVNHEEVDVRAMGQKEAATLNKRQKYGLVKGEEVHNYLRKYAEKWDLVRRIRFKSRVVKAERTQRGNGAPTGWQLTLSSGDVLNCDKIIVATGLYSQPSLPSIPGRNLFTGLSIHSKLLGQQHYRLSDSGINSIVVIGGCKSALETINLCLALPTKPFIHWIIRGDKHGVPIILNDPSMSVSLLALNNTRLFSAFSPSIFDTNSWFYYFFHSGRSWLGTWLCACFWSLMTWALMRDGEYDQSKQGKMIKPKVDNLFRSLLYVSLVHKGNPVLEELHKGERIKVHLGKLDHITSSSVAIHNNDSNSKTDDFPISAEPEEDIKTNAIIWCTGWESSTSFFSPTDTASLGLPIALASQPVQTQKYWSDLHAAADAQLLTTFPALKQWPLEPPKEQKTNYRMYRQILSPSLLSSNDRSIAFVGFVSNSQTAFASEITGLWGVAWLEGLIRQSDLPSKEEMEMDVAKAHTWMARRYGARGSSVPEIVLEIQTYIDLLVKDLGGEVKRKGGWREWLGVYGAGDYKGLIEGVLERSRKGE